MTERRPSPDELLAEVQRREAKQKRGKLKLFFGMAAGVGKTYAMMEEARARADEGLDVLIGYAEPHIRTETEALLLGMEILPYKVVEYRGARLKEFDLDAALARKPTLICIDELAHTNAPGLRHAKRWQDVMELLDAGINVYTTLNVQHLESVNDIVEQITGVKVRETLPDSIFEQADEVELVDIAPEELLERFREGKVYRPDMAERAARHFFTKGNLFALRELALRRTAERVEDQMEELRREQATRTTWAASERVLVCVGPSPMSARLIRSAKRLATSLRADWIAAYVEVPRAGPLPERDRQRLEQNLALAEQLGAQTITLTGQAVAEEVVAYAQGHNVTKIVVGKPDRPRWREILFGSVVDELIRSSGQIDVYVIRGESEEEESPAQPAALLQSRQDWKGHIWAVALVAVATAVGWPLHHKLDLANTNILMLYLLGVLWIATHYSRSAAIAASVLSVAAFDLIFVPPYYAFTVHDRQYIVTFAVMLLTALVISALTLRVRAQVDAARQRERRTAALFMLSRDLAAARTIEEVVAASVRHVADVLGSRTLLLLSDADKRLVIKGGSGGPGAKSPGLESMELDARESGVAQWAYDHDRMAGHGTNTLPAATGMYVPLKTSRSTVGVLGIYSDGAESDWQFERRQLVEALASQAALALERATLADEARDAWERVESEYLRNTLLSGVSHELRTPLAAIAGAASTLMHDAGALPDEARGEMLETIYAESERMERLINNLLDMTRLESGGLVLNKEWQPIQEAIGSILRALDRRLQGRQVRADLPSELLLVNIDAVAIEQVLANLLDNAVEYTPPGTPIDITVRAADQEVVVEIADRGPGLPPGTERRVFEKFFRIRPAESRRGIGLGLAIARGIVEAHGGRMTAANRPGGGAIFTFSLPRTNPPPAILNVTEI